jgi:malonate-semialdehyde dehydrogenase (acetylating)/methylmalonate-semialdehyde dehydrogenase
MAISVAIAVGEENANRLIDELKPRVRNLKIGASNKPGSEMGPLKQPT